MVLFQFCSSSLYKCKHLYRDIMIYRHKSTAIFKRCFTRCLIHSNYCTIIKCLDHLAIGIMNCLTLRKGAIHLPSALKSHLSYSLRLLSVSLKSKSVRHSSRA